jgi:hypothetical protein
MTIRLYADEFRCAIYEEAPGGGDPLDPTSQMNRPVMSPISWLSNVYFHSDLNYYGIAATNLSATISHAAVAGMTRIAGGGNQEVPATVVFYGQAVETNHLLVTHGLGYVPKFFCIYNNRLIPHGTPIQDEGLGLKRFVTAYATSTQIRLHEVGWSSDATLPAVSRTYQVIVFREPSANSTDKQLDLYAGGADFGRGKFRGAEPHLRADGVGDVQWPIATGPTAAIRNGGLRVWTPNGSAIDFGPYNGSVPAPPYIITSAGV